MSSSVVRHETPSGWPVHLQIHGYVPHSSGGGMPGIES
jgi:hypothetical protein